MGGKRFLVRVRLSDGTELRDGGFNSIEAVLASCRSWTSIETATLRLRNGAALPLTALVFHDGQVVAERRIPSGTWPRVEA